jgi:DNA invertase Pin-like site-specific DNA recombinase
VRVDWQESTALGSTHNSEPHPPLSMNPNHNREERGAHDREDSSGLESTLALLPRCIARGVAMLIRVSSEGQRFNVGSLKFQQEQIRHLEPYGAKTEDLRVFDATAESAKPGADRPVFRLLLAAVRAGEVGVVVVADADRVARNDPDAESLYNALADAEGILVVNGEISDPANPGHRMILRIRTAVAQFENDQKTWRSLSSRMSLARDMKARPNLATGLLWASPDDEAFSRHLKARGLEGWLREESLARHRTAVVREGKRYFVFPAPDPAVRRAMRLAVRWLLETGSLTGVLDRIRSHPWWPHPGHFPVRQSQVFREDRRLFKWEPLTGRADGKEELARVKLYGWFRSPSLYGIYVFQSKRLRRISRGAAAFGTSVWEEEAFPAFAPSDLFGRVREILRRPDRARIRGSWTGPRNHALPLLVCSHPMPHGAICGRRVHAMYSTSRRGKHRYLSVACGIRGHRYSLPPEVDEQVLEMICGLFTTEELRHDLERVQQEEGADIALVRQLRTEVADLEARVEWDDERAFRAGKAGDSDSVEYFEQQWKKHLLELKAKRRELGRLETTWQETRAVTEAEYQDILALAADLPRLLSMARPVVGKVREIVREVIRQVHVRRLATGTYHLQLELRSGDRIGRVFISRAIRAPRAIRSLAHARLARFLAPESRGSEAAEAEAQAQAGEFATDLNTVLGDVRVPWTPDRVLAAAYLHEQDAPTADEGRAWEPVDAVARRTGVPANKVLRAALSDRLGPVFAVDGEPRLAATEADLQSVFPSYGRRVAAAGAVWPVKDLVPLSTLVAETGWDRYRVRRVAERGDGVVRDEAGREYTRRSSFRVPEPGDVAALLSKAAPAGAKQGEWLTWTKAKKFFPGVNVTTYEKHTVVVRPGFGENGLATVYIWIDSEVARLVRKPTLTEAVAERGFAPSVQRHFMLRTDALQLLEERLGPVSIKDWQRAVNAGTVIEVRAQGPASRRLRAWTFVPPEVREARDRSVLNAFLEGAYSPPTG